MNRRFLPSRWVTLYIFIHLPFFCSTLYSQEWWETQLEGFEKENPWTQMPNSVNIEITSYALMSLLLRNQGYNSIDS